MSKIKKSELLDIVREQGSAITNLLQRVTLLEKPQLKQLDQSVFKNMHERWRFAAIDADGSAHRFNKLVDFFRGEFVYEGDDSKEFKFSLIGKGYDASNWQNSLIERDITKELTGSELCRAMLARGDRWILCGNTTDGFASPCIIDGYRCNEDDLGFVLTNGKSIEPRYIHPVNNQGEPLTQAEAGL